MRECAYCGASIDENDSFCSSCGAPQVAEQYGEPLGGFQPLPAQPGPGFRPQLPVSAGRLVAIALAAVALFAAGFVIGRNTSNTESLTSQDTSGGPAGSTAQEAEQTAAAIDTTTTTTGAPKTTTTTSTTTTTTEPPFVYSDVSPDQQYAQEIQALVDAEVISPCGAPDGTEFCPDDFLTRGSLASMFAQAFGFEDSGGGDLFVDDNDSPFEQEIQAIANAGITRGCNPPDNNEFCPDGLVTNGQLATFLDRALQLPAAGDVDYFTDDDGTVYEPSIQKLAAAGIMDGCSADDPALVCPGDPVTRGQAAAYLVRAMGQ